MNDEKNGTGVLSVFLLKVDTWKLACILSDKICRFRSLQNSMIKVTPKKLGGC